MWLPDCILLIIGAPNLLVILLWKELAVKGVTVELVKPVLQGFLRMYVYAHAHFKMSHHLRAAAGCIQLAGE